jgi:rod shape-determining protein MreC
MKNLFLILRKLRLLWVFLLFHGISVVFIVRQFNYHQSVLFETTAPLSKKWWSKVKEAEHFLFLTDENELLHREVNRLRMLSMHQEIKRENLCWSTDTALKVPYTWLPARLIHLTLNQSQNRFTINRGRNEGLRPDMGVVGPGGVVGVITQVSPHLATGLTLMNEGQGLLLSVRLKSTGELGNLVWDGKSPCCARIEGLATHVKVKAGDTVETSGLSSIFPRGIPVGYILKQRTEQDVESGYASLRFATRFTALDHVAVLNYSYQAEQDTLENPSNP